MSRSQKVAPTACGESTTGQDNDLVLESTSSQTLRGLSVPNGKSSGFNPYDASPGSTSATGMHRLNNMRQLSERIRMQRDADRLADKKK